MERRFWGKLQHVATVWQPLAQGVEAAVGFSFRAGRNMHFRAQRAVSGRGEMCRTAASKPYRKEVLGLKLEQFPNPWRKGRKLQRKISGRSGGFQGREKRAERPYRKEVLGFGAEAALAQGAEIAAMPGATWSKLAQVAKLAQLVPKPMSHIYGDPRRRST